MFLSPVICLKYPLSKYHELVAQIHKHVKKTRHLNSLFLTHIFSGFTPKSILGLRVGFLEIPGNFCLFIIIFQKVHQGKTSRSNVTFYTTKMTNRKKILTFSFLSRNFHRFTYCNRLLYNKLTFCSNRFYNRLILWDINRINKQTRFDKHSFCTRWLIFITNTTVITKWLTNSDKVV